MTNKSFIPRKDREFLVWIINFLKQLNPMLSRLVFPSSEYQLLSSLRDDFSTKLNLAEEPATRTKVTVKNKNDARKLLEKTVRNDIKEFLNFNRALTGGDRETLGLPIYKTGRTPAKVATEHPDCDIDSSQIRRLIIHFFRQGGRHSKAKLDDQHGMEACWAILAVPPLSISELFHSSFDTHSPLVLDFDECDRGKRVYFAFRWENTRGEKGPWSEIIFAVIP
jgi:hypothetical protein